MPIQFVIDGYQNYLGRHASWIDYNVLSKARSIVENAILQFYDTGFLRKPKRGYRPRDLIYYGIKYVHRGVEGVLGLVLAADGNKERIRNLIVLSVQVPLSPEKARPARYNNCYLTTEIYPGDRHSVIPVTYEFARGTIPGKRLNYIIRHDGTFALLPEAEGIVTGFKHFVSIEYSQYGVYQIDFVLSVRHRPLQPGEAGEVEFPSSKSEFLSKLQGEVSGPLTLIEHELEQDRGTIAPSDIEPGSFLNTISMWMAESAYSQLAIFREELDSKINPRLEEREFVHEVQVPADEEEVAIPYSQIANTLVQHRGALAALLMLADQQGPIEIRRLLTEVMPGEKSLGTLIELGRANLIVSNGETVWLTELGDMIVHRLRHYPNQRRAEYARLE